jgi:DNA-binding GntR family transcriptional regulator
VYDFYSRYMETEHLYSNSTIRIAYARESTSKILQVEKNSPLIMTEESIHHGGRTVIFQKLFFLPDHYELKLMRRNER